LFITILTDYIIPIIYDSFVALAIVLLVLAIFRIRDSSIRIMFFFLPLIKPFLVIAEHFKPHPGFSGSRPVSSGIRLPDPNNLFRWFDEYDTGTNIFITDINYLLIFIAVMAILLLLIIRWFNLYLLYRKLALEDKVTRKEIPRIYRIIDEFSHRISIRPPDVSLTHRHYYSPFVVGVRYCTIVIYPNILEILEQEEKEVILHHEMSHIKRKDNLIGWIAMILRDLLFFNPFAYIAYCLIRAEQDSDSDKLVLVHSRKTAKEIALDLLNAVKKLGDLDALNPAPQGVPGFVTASGRFLAHFRLKNRVRSILKNGSRRIRMRVFPRIIMCILFFLILILQVMVVVNTDQFHLYLR